MFFFSFSRVETYGISMYPLVSHWMLFKVALTRKILRDLLKKTSDCNLKMTVWSGKTILKKRFPPFLFESSKMSSKFSGFENQTNLCNLSTPWSRFSISAFFFGKGKIPHVFHPMRRVRHSHGVVLLAMAVVMFSASNFVLLQHRNPRGRRRGVFRGTESSMVPTNKRK